MAKEHKVVKLEEQTGNFPQYKWYVECSCGFQARLPQEVNVKSQYDAHLIYHGQPVYFATLGQQEAPVEVVVESVDEKKVNGGNSGPRVYTPPV